MVPFSAGQMVFNLRKEKHIFVQITCDGVKNSHEKCLQSHLAFVLHSNKNNNNKKDPQQQQLIL